MTENKILLTCYLFLLTIVCFFLFQQISTSLWGDELWTLQKILIDYPNLLTPGFLGDVNYPTKIIIFKVFSDLANTNSPDILVLLNSINLIFIGLSLYILRNYLSIKALLIFISILLSSEFFLRMFLEIGVYSFVFGISCLFSSFYIRIALFKDESSFYSMMLTGIMLASLHPFSGLFVCSVLFSLFFFIKNFLRILTLLICLCFPIVFLYIFSIEFVDGSQISHINLSFKQLLNTAGFMIPAILLLGCLFLVRYKSLKKDLFFILRISLPLILSMSFILIFSLIYQPVFQARYFTTFFPLTCLLIIIYGKENTDKLTTFSLIFCIFAVSMLYGPRSSLPYTNFQALIEESHTKACINAPIFFNNLKEASYKKYMSEVYQRASLIYSKDFQRPLQGFPYVMSNIDKLIEQFPNCSIFGISGQKKQDVFVSDMKNQLNLDKDTTNINIKETLVKNCYKPGCGILWTFQKTR
ncbi:MAG: hypothetical protein P8J93_06070 [SAR86 cluster bacterium]|nr:hypothetical protein [SAR86 cluster bacterium]